jgi:hypothetical protein
MFSGIILCVNYNISAEAKSLSSTNSDISCILQYLVHNKVVRESDLQGKYKDLPVPSELCDERMKKSNAEFYRQMDRKTSGDRKTDKCIRSTLRQHNVTNIVLKEVTMFHINGQKEMRIIRDLKTIKERMFQTAELICQHQGRFKLK